MEDSRKKVVGDVGVHASGDEVSNGFVFERAGPLVLCEVAEDATYCSLEDGL